MKYHVEVKLRDTETSIESSLCFDTSTLEGLILPIGDLFKGGSLFASTTAIPATKKSEGNSQEFPSHLGRGRDGIGFPPRAFEFPKHFLEHNQVNSCDRCFLEWLSVRLVNLYREHPGQDFVLKLRSIAVSHDSLIKSCSRVGPISEGTAWS